MKNKVGNIIRELRKQKNYKQAYMAYQLHITTTSYANIENGRVDINVSKLHKLAAVLETPASHILFLAEQQQLLLD